jgi:hypothetical protein
MSARDVTSRQVRVRLLTPAGWFDGDLRVPQGTTLLDHLNRAGALIRLGKVGVEGYEEVLPFASVQRGWARLVTCADAAELEAVEHPGAVQHEVAAVLDVASVRGSVALAGSQRVSDFFAAAPDFVAVRDASVWLRRPGPEGRSQRQPALLVHVPSIVAMSDTLVGD